MHNVFVSLPSARGVHPEAMWGLFNHRTELEKAGHWLHGAGVYRMPLDLARNEMACVYLSTTCDLNLLLDDDVWIDRGGLLQMMAACDAGCDIVTAPCRMRVAGNLHGEGNLFNFVPVSGANVELKTVESLDVNARIRTIECLWTGLGAVLVKRRVFEKLQAVAEANSRSEHLSERMHVLQAYHSITMPDRTAASIFRSQVVPENDLLPGSPEGVNAYQLDDRAFSRLVRQLGFRIHAAIDVGTTHDGLHGCFSEEVEKLDQLRKQQRQNAGLVGPDGKRVS